VKLANIVYRLKQFGLATFSRPSVIQLQMARQLLSAPEYELFQQLQPSEQAHSLRVCSDLQAGGNTHPDLLRAALLHDIGKIRYPLRLWERVWIVLGGALFPKVSAGWAGGKQTFWRRPFTAKHRHAAWGAEIVEEIGSSPLTVRLIRRHEEQGIGDMKTIENELLAALQLADNQN